MAQLKGIAQRVAHLGIVEGPRTLVVEMAFGAVDAQNRAERAELHPAGEQFAVPVAADVPADVVAPPTVGHVRGRGGHVRLKAQRIPRHVAVAGEADRIAVVAPRRPSAKR